MAMMKYLPENATIQVGDMVITDGDGSVYPYGIPVGRVCALSVDPLSRTTQAKITPICDFSSLSDVVILKDYIRYAGGEHIPVYGEDAS